MSTGCSVVLTTVGGPVEIQYGCINYKLYAINMCGGAQMKFRCSFNFKNSAFRPGMFDFLCSRGVETSDEPCSML